MSSTRKSLRNKGAWRSNYSPDPRSNSLRVYNRDNTATESPRSTPNRQQSTNQSVNRPHYQYSGKQIGIPEELLPQDTTEWKNKRYKLNENNALSKKLGASKREIQYLVQENGGGLSIACQAGLYELIRRAACQYYAKLKVAGLTVYSIVHSDMNRAIVQVTFKLKTYGGQSAYVVDLYHTTSTIQLSGRNQHRFISDDWPALCEEIHEMNQLMSYTEPDTLNKTMRACLEDILSHTQEKRHKKGNQKPHREELEQLSPKQNRQVEITSEFVVDQIEARIEEETLGIPNQTQTIPIKELRLNTVNEDQIEVLIEEENNGAPNQSDRLFINEPQSKLPITTHGASLDSSRDPEVGHLWASTAVKQAQIEIISQKTPVTIQKQRPERNHSHGSNTHHKNPHQQRVQVHDIRRVPESPISPRAPNLSSHPPGTSPQDTRLPTSDSTNAEVPPQTCSSCQLLRAEWNTSLLDIQNREKKMTQMERNLKAREKEMEKIQAQVETQKAVIIGLEARVKELTATNRILQQVIDADPRTENNAFESRTQDNNTRSQPNVIRQECSRDNMQQEEIRALREELRHKELELRLADRMREMEERIRMHIPAPQQIPHHPMFSPWQIPPPYAPHLAPGLHHPWTVPINNPTQTQYNAPRHMQAGGWPQGPHPHPAHQSQLHFQDRTNPLHTRNAQQHQGNKTSRANFNTN